MPSRKISTYVFFDDELSPAQQRNIESVLRLLSDRLRCSFLLLSYDGTENGYASWPIGSKKII